MIFPHDNVSKTGKTFFAKKKTNKREIRKFVASFVERPCRDCVGPPGGDKH